jgi:hypothetical protein
MTRVSLFPSDLLSDEEFFYLILSVYNQKLYVHDMEYIDLVRTHETIWSSAPYAPRLLGASPKQWRLFVGLLPIIIDPTQTFHCLVKRLCALPNNELPYQTRQLLVL